MLSKLILRVLKHRFYLLLSAGLILVSIVALVFTYNRYTSFYDVDFWKNAVSNFIATFLGLVFGIPIALWVNDIQQESTNEIEKHKLQYESIQRKKIILDSLRTELNAAYELFRDYPGYPLTNASFDWLYWIATAPSLEVWRSFSSGGELQWIEDVNLLKHLAWAYYGIQQIKDVGQLLIETAYVHPRRGGKVIAKYIHKQFERNVADSVRDIKLALDVIDAKFQL
jgi:hypothetical protein